MDQLSTGYALKIDNGLSRLQMAAQSGDQPAFLAAQKEIEWSLRSPGDFSQAIQLALSMGLYDNARHLSAKAIRLYPNHTGLQKYERVLAPPRVTRSNRPPDPTLEANRDWLMSHADTFSGQWVALRNGQLVASADSLPLLVEQIGLTEGLLVTRVF